VGQSSAGKKSAARNRAAGTEEEYVTGISSLPPAKLAAHEAAVARLRDAYAAVPPGTKVRLAKPTSNLFRFREAAAAASDIRHLDVEAFRHVIHVDPKSRTAVVGGMTTYEDLCEATLPHGLMPLVVPQLKTITLGGAVTGLGIESTSLTMGMPHESVIEMQILTGDGRVVIATEGGEHKDLYRGFPNSYGTLGYSLALTIELMETKPYVHLRHFAFNDPKSCMDAIAEIAEKGEYKQHKADFVDGTAFSTKELYLTVGAFSDKAPWLSDYTGLEIFYRSQQNTREDFLTVKDYIWRWDTDWFWCSRPFGVQNKAVRALWPKKYRRSDVYRKLVGLDQKYGLTSKIYERTGRPQQEMVIQDIEVAVSRGREFLEFFEKNVGMNPVWMCPLRLRGDRTWPLYPLKPGEVYVNFGFWGGVPLPRGEHDGYYNRMIEEEVSALGGHKSLYSTSFYGEDEFRERYNGPAYDKLKSEYDGGGRLLGLYDKCVRGR
jgi:FAD/FMN-containing dehydrogenase